MLVSEIGIYKNHQHVEHVALVQDSLGKEWLMDCLLLLGSRQKHYIKIYYN